MDLQNSLHKSLGVFIEAMRLYIPAILGIDWKRKFFDCLGNKQKENWKDSIDNGLKPHQGIDFGHLKSFAIRYKNDFLQKDFGKKANNLPTYFADIADVRNKLSHYQKLDRSEVERAFINMIEIADILKMTELKKELEYFRDQPKKKDKIDKKEVKVDKEISSDNLLPWFKNVRPHFDITEKVLDESVFAANLLEVFQGKGREIYINSAQFFSKTYFTLGLKNIIKRVVKGLNGDNSENRVISLQTGFGGGKTHSLISLFHIAKMGKKISTLDGSKDLLNYVDIPNFDSVNIAVFTHKTNDPVQGRDVKDGLNIKTLWGELAYQLGGIDGYNLIKENDQKQISPQGVFKKVIEKTAPCLILIDELADYCTSALGVEVGESTLGNQTISFVQELSEAISSVKGAVLVATLPASSSEIGSSKEGVDILDSLTRRLSRVAADTKPVSDDEIFEVIRRRLFDKIYDEEIVKSVVDKYFNEYRKLRSEIPIRSDSVEFKNRMLKSYPFHPDLIDIFRNRWASNNKFQKTRGVLRILASIISDIWNRQNSLSGNNYLIHSSDIVLSNLETLTGELTRLFGAGYSAIINADISGADSNSFKVDHSINNRFNLAQGISTTILLGSFGGKNNRGISLKEIKRAVFKTDEFPHNDINGVLSKLLSNAYYLYHSNQRYWFYTKANINNLIKDEMESVKIDEIYNEIKIRVEKNRYSNRINILFPSINDDIVEQKKLTMVIVSPKYLISGGANENLSNDIEVRKYIKKHSEKVGDRDREYKNTIFFLVASGNYKSKIDSSIKEYLACKNIKNNQPDLDKEQIAKINKKINEFDKKIDKDIVHYYSNVIKYCSKDKTYKVEKVDQFSNRIDDQFSNKLLNFLYEKEILLNKVGYNFLKRLNMLPNGDFSEIQTKEIYESFIKFDDRAMIDSSKAIENSLNNFCEHGEIYIAFGELNNYSIVYNKEIVPNFDVTSEDYWIVKKDQYDKYIESLTMKKEETKIVQESKKIDEKGSDLKVQPEFSNKSKEIEKNINKVVISGKIDIEDYYQVFESFIELLKDNNLEIFLEIKGDSTKNKIDKDSFNIIKESAKQLGMSLETDWE